MVARLCTLPASEIALVYDLMRDQDFPDTPDSFDEALEYFKDTHVLALYQEGRLHVAFVLMAFTENAACLDVVCHPIAHGKWASRATLKQLYQQIFERFALDYIWSEPKNDIAMKACFQAGFQLLQTPYQNEPVMALSRQSLAKLIKYERN
jgi:hypothetical protein